MVDDLGRQLLAEIEQEVARKRASGELPAELERELDLAFAELAPEGAVEADFGVLMDRLDATATIDTQASVNSSRPGVAQLKRVVGKAIDWDLRHLASEVGRVNQRLVRALELLDDRVRSLEESVLAQGLPLPPEVAARALPPLPDGPWQALAMDTFAAARGRILQAECRDGSLLASLQASGVDVYGVEGSPLFLAASAIALDVRNEAAFAHLRALPPGTLGGVLLTGCPDVLPAAALVRLLDVIHSRLVPGGALMVVSAGPSGLGLDSTAQQIVAYDLATARPMHPETWISILSARGFGEVRAEPVSPSAAEPYAIIAAT